MTTVLIPTRWYYPAASSGPIPCEWVAWLPGPGSSGGGCWVTLALYVY